MQNGSFSIILSTSKRIFIIKVLTHLIQDILMVLKVHVDILNFNNSVHVDLW